MNGMRTLFNAILAVVIAAGTLLGIHFTSIGDTWNGTLSFLVTVTAIALIVWANQDRVGDG